MLNSKSVEKKDFLTIFKQKLNLNRFDRILSHISTIDADILLTENNKILLDNRKVATVRRSHPEVFLGKGVLKICSKFTGEQPYRSAILKSCEATLLKSHFGTGVLL